MDIVRTASVPPWTRSRPRARRFSLTPLWCFCGLCRKLAKYLNDSMRCLFKLYLLSLLLHLNLVCNNFICELYVICGMYVESCTILVVCWWWIETLRGTQRTTGFIWAPVWKCDRFVGCHCAYALINWTVLSQTSPIFCIPQRTVVSPLPCVVWITVVSNTSS